MFDNIPTSIEYVRAGKLRPLPTTGAMRSRLLPDTPAVNEFLPGYMEEVARIVAQIRRRPCAHILLRADSGFNARPTTALVPIRWFGVQERVLQSSGLSEASGPHPTDWSYTRKLVTALSAVSTCETDLAG